MAGGRYVYKFLIYSGKYVFRMRPKRTWEILGDLGEIEKLYNPEEYLNELNDSLGKLNGGNSARGYGDRGNLGEIIDGPKCELIGLEQKNRRPRRNLEKSSREDYIIDQTQSPGGLENRQTNSPPSIRNMVSRELAPYLIMRDEIINSLRYREQGF